MYGEMDERVERKRVFETVCLKHMRKHVSNNENAALFSCT